MWPFARLYPNDVGESQVSTYSSLNPCDLAYVGDEVRADRAQLPRSDVVPWLTPGDAGTFSGEAFRWALLECFTNGARGIYFWSGRLWDAESLAAYGDVIRALAPVEDVIVDGGLVGDAATVRGRGRLSGMRRGGEMVLLVADYERHTAGQVEVCLSLSRPAAVVDLLSGQVVSPRLPVGEQTLELPLDGARARLLHVKPTP